MGEIIATGNKNIDWILADKNAGPYVEKYIREMERQRGAEQSLEFLRQEGSPSAIDEVERISSDAAANMIRILEEGKSEIPTLNINFWAVEYLKVLEEKNV